MLMHRAGKFGAARAPGKCILDTKRIYGVREYSLDHC